ncbi:hypothetical protein Desgi_0132 [Desulfoscipio gibsoniae DSM 7213]|uniref:Uncharacterized protein n=1 Tax=Desulfoscipio gibsoniae DSM 7213 TaxID=767817 RepID=R4KJD6_9FIRM|nr:hypothetical protein Desgi_0132 [Desulfoscipio gibsoniae DSM 7213]
MLSLLLVSLPEALLVTMLGFQLAGLGITSHHLIKTGMIQTASSYFIRLAPIPFGLHSLVQIVIYIFILRLVGMVIFNGCHLLPNLIPGRRR